MNFWINRLYKKFMGSRNEGGRTNVRCLRRVALQGCLIVMGIIGGNSAFALSIDSEAPDFYANSTIGAIHFHDQLAGRYSILFSHPQDFTPVCTTEIGSLVEHIKDFQLRNTSLYVLSMNTVEEHERWAQDINRFLGNKENVPLPFALIGNSPGFDNVIDIARSYDMLPGGRDNTLDSCMQKKELGSAKDNATVRTVFIIGPDKRIRLTMSYPMTTGRSVDEVLRVLDAIQFTDLTGLATPVNWEPGKPGIVSPGMTDQEARAKYEGVVKINDYLRYADSLKKQPSS